MTSTSWMIAGLLVAVVIMGFIAGYWVGCDVESERAMDREDKFLTDLRKLRAIGDGSPVRLDVVPLEVVPTQVDCSTTSPLSSRLIS